MKKILLYTLMLLSACSNGFNEKSPSFIDVKNEDEWVSYFKVSNSKKFKFSLNDYIGVWKDNHNYDCDFKLNKDLSFEMGWRQAKCKFIEQTNNTLLLNCVGHLGMTDDIVQRYVQLSLYYFPNDMKFGRTKVQKNFDIFIDADKKCANSSISDFKKNCGKFKPTDVFRNYYETEAENFSSCGFFDNQKGDINAN